MALTTCPDCGKEISTAAAACPNCGRPMDQLLPEARQGTPVAPVALGGSPPIFNKPPEKKKGMGTGTKVVLGGLGAMIFLYWLGGKSEHEKSPDATGEPVAAEALAAEAPPTETLDVSATELVAAYDANEVSADNSYKGKTLRVTGLVESIDKGILNDVFVMIGAGRAFHNVHASMASSEADRVARLSKGDRITVVCKGRGKVIGSPMLRDCVIR